jgi:phosphate-selective porin OprO/OprP
MMYKTAILLILLCFCNLLIVKAQRNVDISNLPYYNFGKGVGITSPDSIFQLNIRFRIQNRFEVQKPAGKPYFFDGQVRRLRLRFDGYVGNPRFLYVLQLSFAPGDVGQLEDGENINIIRDAVVYYRYSKKLNLGFGQTKLPGNRQRVNSSGALQLTDRSIVNSKFNIDRDFGFFANWFQDNKHEFSWNIRSAISTGDGRNFTRSPDSGLAYTAKAELLPFGLFSKDGVYFEGDLVREARPKMMLSIAWHYNHKAKRQAGVLGDDLYQNRNLRSVLADFLFKYRGWALMATYMNRHTLHPVTMNDVGQQKLVYTGQGSDLQASYLTPSGLEIISRLSILQPAKEVRDYFPNQAQCVIGLTKYVWEHAFKVQLEGGVDRFSPKDEARTYNPYVRLQVEMGI